MLKFNVLCGVKTTCVKSEKRFSIHNYHTNP